MQSDSNEIRVRQEKRAWVLTLPPTLEASVEDSLVPAVENALSHPNSRLLLDFSLVSFANSAGIGVIVDTLRRAAARSVAVSITGLQGQPQLVLERIGLLHYVTVFQTVDDALAGEGQE